MGHLAFFVFFLVSANIYRADCLAKRHEDHKKGDKHKKIMRNTGARAGRCLRTVVLATAVATTRRDGVAVEA
jgi:hypothetical protein